LQHHCLPGFRRVGFSSTPTARAAADVEDFLAHRAQGDWARIVLRVSVRIILEMLQIELGGEGLGKMAIQIFKQFETGVSDHATHEIYAYRLSSIHALNSDRRIFLGSHVILG
jgi:hypothetical protein